MSKEKAEKYCKYLNNTNDDRDADTFYDYMTMEIKED